MRRRVVLMIAVLMVGGFASCSSDDESSSTTRDQTTVAAENETTTTSTEAQSTSATSLPATSTVTVTVTDIEDAVGYELVGFVVKGGYPEQGEATAVGGFGVVAVDADPFSTTQVVRAAGAFPDFDAGWPNVTDQPAMLEPGNYHLNIWLDQPLNCCYSDIAPGLTPSLRLCSTVFTVKEDEQVTITVSGITSRSGDPSLECPTG